MDSLLPSQDLRAATCQTLPLSARFPASTQGVSLVSTCRPLLPVLFLLILMLLLLLLLLYHHHYHRYTFPFLSRILILILIIFHFTLVVRVLLVLSLLSIFPVLWVVLVMILLYLAQSVFNPSSVFHTRNKQEESATPSVLTSNGKAVWLSLRES